MSAGPFSEEAGGEAGIPDGSVREQLGRTLACKSFSNAPRASRFLQYIVEKSLSEPGAHIGEYELGTEVFEKDPKTFDPRIDNDVRVGATRLRERLRRYYEAEGAADPIRIELPTGGFRPVFHLPGPTPPAEPETAKPEEPPQRRRLRIWLAAAVLGAAVIIGVVAGWRSASPGKLPRQKRIVVLLFKGINADPKTEILCRGLTTTLAGKLTELERFQVFWVVPATEVLETEVHLRDAKEHFGVNLAVTGTVESASGKVRVTVSLIDTDSDELRQLKSEVIDAALEEHFDVQNKVVRALLRMLDIELSAQADEVLRAGGSTEPRAEHYWVVGRGWLDRGPESLDQAIELFNAAIGKDPKFALAHAGLGEAYLKKYEVDKEGEWIRKAQESCSRALEINRDLAPVRVTLGMIASATGKDEDAVKAFQSALKIDPSSFGAHQGLAKALQRLRKLDEAEQAYRRAVELKEDYWRGHKELGVFYYNYRSRYDLALACFLEAKKLAPENVQIALIDSNLGGVYIQMGRMAEAERALLASLARKPVAEAYNNLGAAYYYQGKYMESAEAMKKAVELGKTDPQLLGSLAYMYVLTGRSNEAQPLFEEAIRKAEEQLRVNPADADLLTELALIRVDTGDKSRALKHVEEARKREPENNDVLFRSVLVYERTDNRRLALKAVEEILRRGPLMWEIELDPVLAELRQDPGYKALISGSSTRKTNRTP